jgi:hypothetical protein
MFRDVLSILAGVFFIGYGLFMIYARDKSWNWKILYRGYYEPDATEKEGLSEVYFMMSWGMGIFSLIAGCFFILWRLL